VSACTAVSMRSRVWLAMPLAVMCAGIVDAQTPARASNVSPFRPLELPAPNAFRDAAGRPGPRYWQQRVNYAIAAELDTAAQTIRGH